MYEAPELRASTIVRMVSLRELPPPPVPAGRGGAPLGESGAGRLAPAEAAPTGEHRSGR